MVAAEDRTATALCDAAIEAVTAFTGGQPRDDFTLLAARFLPASFASDAYLERTTT